jgi:uncharacterized protein (DUF849 family)
LAGQGDKKLLGVPRRRTSCATRGKTRRTRGKVRRGLDTRIGLEDTLSEPNGERTAGNEALVRAARELGAGTE